MFPGNMKQKYDNCLQYVQISFIYYYMNEIGNTFKHDLTIIFMEKMLSEVGSVRFFKAIFSKFDLFLRTF